MHDSPTAHLVLSGQRWLLLHGESAANGELPSSEDAWPSELVQAVNALRWRTPLSVWLGAHWCPAITFAGRGPSQALPPAALQAAQAAMALAQAGVALPAGGNLAQAMSVSAERGAQFLLPRQYLRRLQALCGWRVRLVRVSPLWLAVGLSSEEGLLIVEEPDALTAVARGPQGSVGLATTRVFEDSNALAAAREQRLLAASGPVRHFRLNREAPAVARLFVEQ